jgi:glycosyltransferase involved in cell wall biosynthesis
MPYYTALTTLDIGLVPLGVGKFNHCKSYLKALEYAACGVAVVASDTPAHRALAASVPLRLARTPREWYDHIADLIEYPEARADMVAEARQQVFQWHTYEANAGRWVAAWERAMSRRAALKGR